MANIIEITDFSAPELDVYARLTENQLLCRADPSQAMFLLKKLRPNDRPMTTPLFLLRCVQLGISIRDLDLLTIGMVNDMYAESSNDEYKGYAQIATQRDFDAF